MPSVSIVIPNYNGERYLKDCIEALREQSYLDFETILIDNASTDSSYEWLSDYENIIFKRLDKNYGFSRAVNEGIQMARGKYVLLLNNDTIVERDFVKALVEAIEEDERIFGVSSKMIAYQDHSIMDDAGDEYSILGWAYKLGDGKSVELFDKAGKVFSACAGAALYRKAVFDEIGLFDESFFAYMEDVDISYRARIYGYYNIYCPEAKVYHIGSATSGSKYNDFKVKLSARNNIYVPYKNMPFLQLLVNLPALFIGGMIKYIWFQRKGFGKAYKQGLVEGFKTLKQVKKVPFRERRIVNYLHIEYLLIKNTFKYIIVKMKKANMRDV